MANQTAQGSFYVATNTKFLSSEINRNETMHRSDLAAFKTALFFGTPMVVSGLAVSPGTGLQVTVAPGNGIDGAGLPIFIPTSVPSTATAFGLSAEGTAPNANLATADATNPRIDLICLRAATLQTDYASIAVNNGTSTTNQTVAQTLMNYFQIVVVTGTPAASPVAPAAQQATDLVIAQVRVNAGATSITAGNITDVRKIMGGVPTINNANTFSALQTLTAGLTVSSGTTALNTILTFNGYQAQPANSNLAGVVMNSTANTMDVIGGTGGWKFVTPNGTSYGAVSASLTTAGALSLASSLTVQSGGATISSGGLSLTGQNNPVSVNPAATVGDSVYQVGGKNALGILPGYVGSSMTSTLFVNTASGTEGASFPNLKLWGAVAIPQTLNVTGATTLAGVTATSGTFSNGAMGTSDNMLLITETSGTGATGIRITHNSADTGAHSYGIFSTGTANTTGVGALAIYDYTASAYRLVLGSTGNVGIGKTNPSVALDVVGAGSFTSGLTATTGTFSSDLQTATRLQFTNWIAQPTNASGWGMFGNSTASSLDIISPTASSGWRFVPWSNTTYPSAVATLSSAGALSLAAGLTATSGTFSGGVNSGGTASTGPSNANYWYKVATVTITGQYAYQAGVVSLFTPNGSGSATATSALINFSVKQQSSMGAAPSVQVQILADYGFNAMVRVVAVITSNTSAQTVVTLYAQCAWNYENIQISLLNSYGGLTIINGDGGVASLPAGTQIKPSSTSLLLTDNGIGIGSTSPARLLHLNGGATSYLRFDATGFDSYTIGNDSNGFVVYDDTASAYRFAIRNNGAVIAGGASDNGTGAKLQVNGPISENGSLLANTYAPKPVISSQTVSWPVNNTASTSGNSGYIDLGTTAGRIFAVSAYVALSGVSATAHVVIQTSPDNVTWSQAIEYGYTQSPNSNGAYVTVGGIPVIITTSASVRYVRATWAVGVGNATLPYSVPAITAIQLAA